MQQLGAFIRCVVRVVQEQPAALIRCAGNGAELGTPSLVVSPMVPNMEKIITEEWRHGGSCSVWFDMKTNLLKSVAL